MKGVNYVKINQNRKILTLCFGLSLLWCFFTLYPNPIRLYQSIQRSIIPPIDTLAVQPLIHQLESRDPVDIERFVLYSIPYQYDWVTYNVPWYYPSVSEVIQNGTGDCKSRMILFASILEYLGIEYQIRYSLNHYWVHYEGKAMNQLENEAIAFYIRDDNTRVVQLPDIDWRMIGRTLADVYAVMPVTRKVLFLAGLLIPTPLILTTQRFWGRREQELDLMVETVHEELS